MLFFKIKKNLNFYSNLNAADQTCLQNIVKTMALLANFYHTVITVAAISATPPLKYAHTIPAIVKFLVNSFKEFLIKAL